MIISEDEAKQYPDLYQFETMCLDFIAALKKSRQRQLSDFMRNTGIDAGKEMLIHIPVLMKEMEA